MVHTSVLKKGSVLMASIVLMVIAALATISWLGYLNASYRASTRDWEQTQAFYAAEAGIEKVIGLFNDPVIDQSSPNTDVIIAAPGQTFSTTSPEGAITSSAFDQAMTFKKPPKPTPTPQPTVQPTPQPTPEPTPDPDPDPDPDPNNNGSPYGNQMYQPANYPLMHNVHPQPYLLFEPYIVSYALDENGQPMYNEDGELIITKWTYFQNLAAGSDSLVSKTSKIPSCELDPTQFPELKIESVDGDKLATVSRIQLVHPTDIEAQEGSLPEDIRIVSKLIATGVSERSGVEITIETLLTENPAYALSMPGAIISDASAEFSGNFNVHWGELWAKDDVLLPTNFLSKIPRYEDGADFDEKKGIDAWFRLRTTKRILDSKGTSYADGRVNGGFSGTEVAKGEPVYYAPYLEDYLDVKNKTKFQGLGNMLQHQDLSFPNYSYSDWKTMATTYGFGYYYTYTDGLIYGVESDPDSIDYGTYVGKSYDAWFNISPEDSEYGEITQKLAFIDSIPVDDEGNVAPKVGGVPVIDSQYYPRDPDDPACKMTTIQLSGGSLHTRGAMFIVANMDMTGQGNPPSSDRIPDVIMPNFEQPDDTFKVFHNGLLYCWGTVAGGGNRTIYGCIYTRGGYDASGTPAVYYNVRMRDGSWLNFNVSRVLRTRWDIISNPG